MDKFNSKNLIELNDFLYNSYIHDALIEKQYYNEEEKQYIIEIFNHTYNKGYMFVFTGVEEVKHIKGNWIGSNKQINTLVCENDSETKDSLYLYFEMISGDGIEITAETVYADEISELGMVHK